MEKKIESKTLIKSQTDMDGFSFRPLFSYFESFSEVSVLSVVNVLYGLSRISKALKK